MKLQKSSAVSFRLLTAMMCAATGAALTLGAQPAKAVEPKIRIQALKLLNEKRITPEEFQKITIASAMLTSSNYPDMQTQGNYPNMVTAGNYPDMVTQSNYPNMVTQGNYGFMPKTDESNAVIPMPVMPQAPVAAPGKATPVSQIRVQALKLLSEERISQDQFNTLFTRSSGAVVQGNFPDAVVEGNFPNAVTAGNFPDAVTQGNFGVISLDGSAPTVPSPVNGLSNASKK